MQMLLVLTASALCTACLPGARADDPDKKTGGFTLATIGFDKPRDGVPHGKVEVVEYDSRTVGAKRKAVVYTPPGYSKDQKYPVLYLLHGIGDDEAGWRDKGSAAAILDNLLADRKMVPMVVVMPNGRAATNVTIRTPWPQQFPAFAAFEKDLLADLIPFVESRYAVQADRDHRALAGLSMGGGQALNFGLAHPDVFAWVGGFSSAPNTRPPDDLADLAARGKFKLVWISCGDKDNLLDITKNLHTALDTKGVQHTFLVQPGNHTWAVWKDDLYLLAQVLFK